MNVRHSFYRRYHKWLRHLPRRKHLRGSWLHRWLGERLFARELWRPDRHGVAAGLALGLFIGLTPTMGVQIFLGAIAAYLLRVNIPAACAGALVTNPFTAPVIYPLEYQFGVWMVGVPAPKDLHGYSGMLVNFARFAKPLWAGSVVTGCVVAAITYGLVTLLWKEANHLGKALHRPPPADAPPPTSPPAEPAPVTPQASPSRQTTPPSSSGDTADPRRP